MSWTQCLFPYTGTLSFPISLLSFLISKVSPGFGFDQRPVGEIVVTMDIWWPSEPLHFNWHSGLFGIWGSGEGRRWWESETGHLLVAAHHMSWTEPGPAPCSSNPECMLVGFQGHVFLSHRSEPTWIRIWEVRIYPRLRSGPNLGNEMAQEAVEVKSRLIHQ